MFLAGQPKAPITSFARSHAHVLVDAAGGADVSSVDVRSSGHLPRREVSLRSPTHLGEGRVIQAQVSGLAGAAHT
jgi:hypothetical protein